MDIKIRNEGTEDYRIVEEVAREAFWNLYIPGCHEHFLIHNMRNHPDFIPELSFSYKEKCVQESQNEFEMASSMLDE